MLIAQRTCCDNVKLIQPLFLIDFMSKLATLIASRLHTQLAGLFAGISLVVISTQSVCAQGVHRIWVDATGLHSVQASLVKVAEDKQFVVLRRADGGIVRLAIDQLSDSDRQYVDKHLIRTRDQNLLRIQAPTEPNCEPLPVLELASVADETHPATDQSPPLTTQCTRVIRPVSQLPKKLVADPSPWSMGCRDALVSIDRIDFSDDVSQPIPIVVTDDWQTRTTSVAFSVSGHSMIPGQRTRKQLIRIDFASGQAVVAMQNVGRLRLMDHHTGRGRSLLLTGHGAMNDGGSLAFAEGWDGDNVSVVHRRRLPGVESSAATTTPKSERSTDSLRSHSSLTKLHWAKMIDAQHVLAHVGNQIVLWNLVSGDTVYRIDHVDPRCEPAVSGGRRYLAVPKMAAVDLYNIETGKALGRIKVERQMPGVSFSPFGNALAIVSSRRIRTWNLVDAALDADITSRESLGQGSPTWIDHDLLISSNGILVSQFRGVPIWKYDLTAAEVSRVGKHVAVLRKEPWSQLVTMQLPHEAAKQTIQQIDASIVKLDPTRWRIPGRSHWDGGEWVDRTSKVAQLPIQRR